MFLHIINIGATRANSDSGHVRHMAILSMHIKNGSWETYLDITCDEFVYMNIQWLRFEGCIDFVTENSFSRMPSIFSIETTFFLYFSKDVSLIWFKFSMIITKG